MSNAMTRSLQALSDPTRRHMLRLLRDGDKTAGQLGEDFEISAPSVSHHLSVLKQAELVSARRDGQTIVYSLNATVLQELLQALVELYQDAPAPAAKPARARRNGGE
jgi:ArsR family transcriptional regulator, arsenate/arsenite/antimonite-responsive transcriptional repressor